MLDTLVSELDLQISVEHELVGFDSHKKYGTTLRDELLARAQTEFDGIILGPMSTMDYPSVSEGGRNVSGGFRVALDLYSNVRPAKSRPGIPNKATGMDLVIYRENTEGFYPDRNMYQGVGEMMPDPDMALSVEDHASVLYAYLSTSIFSRSSATKKNRCDSQSKCVSHDRWVISGVLQGSVERVSKCADRGDSNRRIHGAAGPTT